MWEFIIWSLNEKSSFCQNGGMGWHYSEVSIGYTSLNSITDPFLIANSS